VRRDARASLAVSLAVVLAACSAPDASAPRCIVKAVNISAVTGPLRVGSTSQLAATVLAEGCASAPPVLSWASSAPSIVAVTPAGAATAVAPGRATIRASHASGPSGSIQLEVEAVVARVDVTPVRDTLVQGDVRQLVATPRAADGTALSGRPVTWRATKPATASVSATGLVTALSPGTDAAIEATSEGVVGTTIITVLPPPLLQLSTASIAFTATAGAPDPAAQQVVITNGGGGVLAGLATGTVSYGPGGAGWLELSLPVTSAAPTATLVVQPRTAALPAGSYRADVPVLASAPNAPLTITVTLTVRSVPVGSIEVTPATSVLAVGAKQTLQATVRDPSGSVLSGRAVRWSSSNPLVAAIDAATGLVTAASIGVATMTATADGVTGAGFVYTGTASPYDGTWRGTAGPGRTFAMTVHLGRITTLSIGVGTPPGSPCPLTYLASPLTRITGNAFAFSTSGGSTNAAVSGNMLSSASAQGSYGTITFDRYQCPPNRLVTGTVPGGSWTAARQ
jgi:uncharacterized protein YjdB